jgi:type II secretory pathway component GspD/PulD (secretin)
MNRLLLLVLCLAPAALAQGTLEVIALRHRTADQVIPVLRPLLEAGGALSGQANQLIVRTSAANLAQLRAALDAIDRPQRRLVISVRFDNQHSGAGGGIQTDARISNRGSGAEVRVVDSRSALDERVDQRVQVLEGGRAVIAAGESRPLRQRQVIHTPGGTVIQESVGMQDAATGFEVVPRIAGGNVVLEVAQQREQFAQGVSGTSGAMRAERIVSTASARLGEWFELGGTSETSTRSDSGILSSRGSTTSGNRRIWVKVEEIH